MIIKSRQTTETKIKVTCYALVIDSNTIYVTDRDSAEKLAEIAGNKSLPFDNLGEVEFEIPVKQ